MHEVIKDMSQLAKRSEWTAASEIKYWFFFGSHVSPSAFLYCSFLQLINFIFYKMLYLQLEIRIPYRHFFLSKKLFLGVCVVFSTSPACLIGFSFFCATIQVWFFFTLKPGIRWLTEFQGRFNLHIIWLGFHDTK